MNPARTALRDSIVAAGPEHFTMDRWGKIRRPWGEWEPLTLRGLLRLTPEEIDAPETVVHLFGRAALLAGWTLDDVPQCGPSEGEHTERLAEMYALPRATADPRSWGYVVVDGWNMADAFDEAYGPDPERTVSTTYHPCRQRHWWNTALALLDRLDAADDQAVAPDGSAS